MAAEDSSSPTLTTLWDKMLQDVSLPPMSADWSRGSWLKLMERLRAEARLADLEKE